MKKKMMDGERESEADLIIHGLVFLNDRLAEFDEGLRHLRLHADSKPLLKRRKKKKEWGCRS
jgi:hypothetical protein